jgi:3-hydroxyisobutyrate dehydrogenase-like beta-hydroxyacid dehydrogenase
VDVGFIGVGNIGMPMARRLLKAGHHLIVCDLNSAAVDRVQAEGATVAGSPADIANAASLVMASLPTPQSVQVVVGGDKGLVNGKTIRCFVDLSTTGPTVAKQVAQLLGSKGIVQIDAPVSGGVHGAEAGKLAVMASGPRQQFEFVEPILSNLGRVFFVGEAPGLGQAMKLVNNYLSAATLALTSEATVMGVRGRARPRQDDRGAQSRFGAQQRHRRQVSALYSHRHLRLRLCGRPNVQGRFSFRTGGGEVGGADLDRNHGATDVAVYLQPDGPRCRFHPDRAVQRTLGRRRSALT